MFIHHWSDYIIDPKEWKWYEHKQARSQEFKHFPYKTNSRELGIFETILKDLRMMANERRKKTTRTATHDNSVRWVNVPISDDDYAGLEEFLDSKFADFIGYLCNLAERGISISLKPGRDDDYMCTFIWRRSDSEGEEQIGLSTFAVAAGDAIGGNLYKYFVLTREGTILPDKTDATRRRIR